MARLFIFGNGYDISRRGDTSYNNFKKWLEQRYLNKMADGMPVYSNGNIILENCESISAFPSDLTRSMVITENEEEVRQFNEILDHEDNKRKYLAIAVLFVTMEQLEDEDWQSFEDNLAKIPLKLLISCCSQNPQCKKEALVGSPIDRPTDLFTSLSSTISSLFAEWVENLPSEETQKKCFEKEVIKDVSSDDTFLIFNYTKTVESLFRECAFEIFYHVHGIADDPHTIVFGHNHKEKSVPTNLDNDEDYINECFVCLYKNPEGVIQRNQALWDRLSGHATLDIYEYGWSCSDTDRDYICKIVSLIKGKNVNLYLNDYNGSGESKKKQWISCGFPKQSIHLYIETEGGIQYTSE